MSIERVSTPMDWIEDPGDDAGSDAMPVATRIERWVDLAAVSVAEAGIAAVQRREARTRYDEVIARSRRGQRAFGGVERLAVKMAERSYAFSVSNASVAVERIVDNVAGASYDEKIKERVSLAANQVARAFPWAKDVRDTYAHMEDRVLGQRRDKPIQNQPVEIPGLVKIKGGGTGNFVEIGVHDGFFVTLGNGTQAQVTVTEDEARRLRDRIQDVIDSLPWRSPDSSPRRVHPSD